MRGARSAWVIGAVFAGIIPACAGSTSPWPSASARCGDHPRMCGEHSSGPALIADIPGSSPHVRGAHAVTDCETPPSGIIPACAGSTVGLSVDGDEPWDHPRMCGEHFKCDSYVSDYVGSSPHVRGAPYHRQYRSRASGIIPACAGSTPRMFPCRCVSRDHPRMCGEHTSKIA